MKRLKFAIFSLLTALALGLPPFASAATLSLLPASGTFNRGCNFSLQVQLDTTQPTPTSNGTDGTDVILFYDANSLNAVSITNGTIYPDYPGNVIDPQASPQPKISISGLASITQPFSGTGVFATVNFRVADNAPIGQTQVKFSFNPNTTTESNVVERGTVAQLLASVNNGTYTIGTGPCAPGGAVGSASPTPAPTAQSTFQPFPTTPPISPPVATPTAIPRLPNTANISPTIILSAIGGTLILAGIAGLIIF